VGKELVNEEKAIVLDVVIGGIRTIVMMLELVTEVVADIYPEGVPQNSRIRGVAVTKNGDK
jgi:hypothetical protein